MKLHYVSILDDNYVWILSNSANNCIIVDPGQSKPVINYLQQNKLTPLSILLTHHHADHIGGVVDLVNHYPSLTTYGPKETRNKLTTVTNFSIVTQNQIISIADFTFTVMAVPGHTLGHIAFYMAPYLFCGDTLFSAGCGRISEGTAQQMYQSIMSLCALPDETLVCCSHEYTLSNLRFAHAILPNDCDINDYLHQVEEIRKNNQSTLPTTLKQEKKINLFLRSSDPLLREALKVSDKNLNDGEIFAILRKLKDNQ